MPSRHNKPSPLEKTTNRHLKRGFDIIFSFIVLTTLAIPVFIPVAVMIKLTSDGPVIFRQKRTGLHGKTFYCLKFRSMRVNSECDSICATRNDTRITHLGRILRKLSIDELPQFWNTLTGDMSVVGPRPHMCSMSSRYASIMTEYSLRENVKPGITGWAQVNGFRGNAEDIPLIRHRIEHDMWYMRHWTFLLDIKIISLTIFNIISGKDKNAF